MTDWTAQAREIYGRMGRAEATFPPGQAEIDIDILAVALDRAYREGAGGGGHPREGGLVEGQERAIKSREAGLCCCWRCIQGRGEMPVFMVLCPTCGNKRCPKASYHAYACTGSNEPDQPGSVY